jgi:choline dehydrogenase-like flavoprotein
MAFIATSKINVDAWGKLRNDGWDWESLKPYFQKAHTLTLPSGTVQTELGLEYVNDTASGSSGPIQASFPDAIEDLVARAWIETFQSLGYRMTKDPFSGDGFGGYTNAATIDPVTKTRSYATNAYYEPVGERPNLQVITGALVEKILLETAGPADHRATGVKYQKDGYH